MSGGSWEYFYQSLDEVADRLTEEKSPLRRAFGEHMRLCAKAMHDIEWADSGDTAKGSERPSIEAAFAYTRTATREMEILLRDGREVVQQLKSLGVDITKE